MARPELHRLVPDAPQALIDILDGSRGPVEPPIRSEIFGALRFAQHGRSLGQTHRAAATRSRAATFMPRLQGNIRALREAHRYIGAQASTGYDISPAAEWLLDNFHLIEAQLKEIHEGLPRSYFRALPMLLDEPLAGLPRIYGVAWAFVAHTDGAFDEDLLALFLSAYQETRELNLSELWALPTTLRVVLVENLRRLAERVATNKAARAVANLCCDHIDRHTPQSLDRVLALLAQRGVGGVFLAQMAQRLQHPQPSDNGAQPASESGRHLDWLRGVQPDLAALQAQQPADQAADNLSVSNAVTSLRAVGDADWPGIVCRTSPLMRLMLGSPLFEAEHTVTRDRTLHGIELLSRRSGRNELEVAQVLLGQMQLGRMHSGHGQDGASEVASHWLTGPGRPAMRQALGLSPYGDVFSREAWAGLARRVVLPAYLGALLLGTLGLVAWMLVRHSAAGAEVTAPWLALLGAALMLFPSSEAVVAVMHRLISESARPSHLPRLALANGIPAEHRVMVVVPAMLTDAASAHALAHRLQLHHLANPEAHAQFALLTDWADADTEHLPSDAASLQGLTRRVAELNARFDVPPADADAGTARARPPRFIVLHRQRRFSETEQRWIGWERKRGKLECLLAALAGGSAESFLNLGEASRMAAHTRYVVTLDSDTQLPPGRLRELVSVAAHPQNQPRLDARGRNVVAGYGILQPRIVTPLPAPKELTLFHWLFAGQCGIDPYSAASSEVYQDLFGEGTFTGKGLLNVQAVHAVLSSRLPEGQVLSHDLLEGSVARCAAVSDITLIEDAPFHSDVAASRVHRWTRGDWQLLPFLLGTGLGSTRGRNRARRSEPMRLKLVNRWKMLDNLRRSLVAPMSLALLLLALGGAVVSPWAALALVLAAFSAGPLMGAVAGFSPSRDDLAKRHFYRQAGAELARAVCGGVWLLGQLLQQSLMAVDAVVRALYRMGVSHRHLLQWTTAATAQSQARTRLASVLRQHWSLPVVAALLAAALLAVGSPTPALALTLCLMWAASPIWTWWGSRTRPVHEDAALPASDQAYLEGVARDTWRFFERCVVAGDNHLPPDNLQVAPHDAVAHRTSPTNIGLYLLSVACARAFGWIGTQDLLTRMEATLATLATLERHRGHFLNWYDTQTCAPLLPTYVSTVDSGNLGGHLIAVAQACRELANAPHDPCAARRAIASARQRLAPLLAERNRLPPAQRDELRWHLADHRATLRSAALDVREALSTAGNDAQRTGCTASHRLHALARTCEQLAFDADYGFLYHPRRHLLHIGYRVAEQQLDAGFYDLLASESRLTSLLAVAKGDVPVRHWATLGRPFFAIGADAGLRSWSGSMFEYLMPSLVLAEPHGSALREACHAALREQISFAHAHDVPWGISESAYAGRDHTLAYQYAPQGVPRLALRRTPPDELVIAPYATALAAQIAPRRSTLNLRALEAQGARARYGFIEALDFTPARQNGTERFTPVHTFMAHHQGMSIVALANVLLGEPAQRWGMADPHVESVASLLHERVPREVSVLSAPPSGPAPQPLQRRTPGLLREVVPGESALEPTHVLSNGRYSVSLRANGAGWSRWKQAGITRWRDDALRDAHGSFFYLRWPEPVSETDVEPAAAAAHDPRSAAEPLSRLFSITQHPAPDPAARYLSRYHADRVCFDAVWPELQAHTTVWVSPEDDIEFRQVELHNLSDRTVEIELISAFEVTLTDPRADEAHPAFTNLFVRAEWRAQAQALVFERKPRLPTEPSLQAAHFLAETDPQVIGLSVQTDRQRWRGRNHGASWPLASLDPAPTESCSVSPSATSTGACAAAPVETAAGATSRASGTADTTTTATPTRPPADAGAGAGVSLDTGLDPVSVLAVRLRIAPHGKARLTFATAASDNAGTLTAVIDKYRQSSHVERASLMSATLAGIRLRALRIGPENFAAVQMLTTAMVLSLTRPLGSGDPAGKGANRPEATRHALGMGVCDRRLLWRFGVSGDRPILLVSAGVLQGLGLLRSLAQGLSLWAWGGITCDLVVVNAEPASYMMTLQREIAALRDRHLAERGAEPGPAGAGATGFHLLRIEEVSADELSTLQTLACVRIHADGRPLVHHVREWVALHEQALVQRQGMSTTSLAETAGLAPAPAPARARARAPGGVFDAISGEFRFDVCPRSRPLRPWINVLSNPAFGAQISEAGSGYTWAVNSRLNQLTAWSNDPVADPSTEWFLLQDLHTMAVWSVSPGAGGDALVVHRVAHGQGYSVIGHRHGDLQVNASWCVDPQASVKQVRLRVVNRGHRTVQLRIVGIVEWMMGAHRADRSTVHTSLFRQRLAPHDALPGSTDTARGRKLTALMCTQPDRSAGFGDGTAFFGVAGAADETEDWTCDRRECFDARGRVVLPDHLGQRSGRGLDPCAALSTRATLAAGDAVERTFLLGYADSPAAARQLATLAAATPPTQRLEQARTAWDRWLGATTVTTPDPLFDAMVNRWLLYQTVTCRLWAKAGFYQAGGATGFRDQLQDAMALVWAAPQMLRAQILLCASRQFAQGDVQHWWHAPTGAGVRTHFSDDLLWLAHATHHYLRATGDAMLLDEHVPFLEGSAIPEGAEDVYETPEVGSEGATVYEHAARAIDRSLRVGAHGLPLMGSGDWNDGMNRVGIGGRGESVWLGWFLCRLVADFAPLAHERGDTARAQRWEAAAQGWRAALIGPAWDGQWFKRAFFDDGQPLGSHDNPEARIDLIAQAWAVLSGVAPPQLQHIAMAAVEEHLVDPQSGLIRLLDPPLVNAVPSAGYIQAYPPGVRENGGQYSHGAVWAVMARAELDRGAAGPPDSADAAYRYFKWLSPAHRARHPTQGPAYGIEPYVMAGDVYTQPPYSGRGGWSWYTGSAAWMHRAAIESIFGLHQTATSLWFTPCLPSHWPHAELTLRRDGRTMRFVLVRAAPDEALAAAAAIHPRSDARLLHPGEVLDWERLPAESCHVVPLPGSPTATEPSGTAAASCPT